MSKSLKVKRRVVAIVASGTLLAGVGTALSMGVADAASVSNGSIVHLVNSPNQYLVANGKLHWVPNSATFNAMGLSWNKTQAVSTFPLPIGRPVDLIKMASSPRVYLEEAGQLHWITNSRLFNSLGYQWRDVFMVHYLPLPVGSPVTGIAKSQIVLYAADPVDYASAQRIATNEGISLANVTGNYATAWADTTSGVDLVIAVGSPANNALYFNPSGWAGKPAGYTPFLTTRGWMATLPGRNFYENASGYSAQDSFDLATDAVEYALGQSLSYQGISVYPPQNVRSGANPVS